jgi:hypothetical protein
MVDGGRPPLAAALAHVVGTAQHVLATAPPLRGHEISVVFAVPARVLGIALGLLLGASALPRALTLGLAAIGIEPVQAAFAGDVPESTVHELPWRRLTSLAVTSSGFVIDRILFLKDVDLARPVFVAAGPQQHVA